MATKATGTDSFELSKNLKRSKTGSRRATRNLFSRRRIVGRNDLVVDLNLGKVVIPKEEAVGVIKEEEISQDLENGTASSTAVEDEEDVQVKVVGEEVNVLDNFEVLEGSPLLTCSCACWNKIESLEAIVEEQGRQILNLNNVVMGLLGKQVASEQVQRPPGEHSVMHPVNGESQPTQAGDADRDKVRKGVNTVTENLVLVNEVHQRQPEMPCSEILVISVAQAKNERSACTASAKKGSSRRLPSHPKTTGVFSKRTKDGDSTKPKQKGHAGASGQNHACPHCSKEGRHRFFSTHKNLQRHVQEKHSLKKKPHKCDTCSKTFSRKEFLDRHIKMVHEGVRYMCAHCTGSYVNRSFLMQHEKIHARGVPLIRCQVCGLNLISDESLKRHLGRCHAGGKKAAVKKRPRQLKAPPPRKKVCVKRSTWDCPHCEKRFDCDASLRYHLHKKHGILQTRDESSVRDGVKGRFSQD